MPALLLGHSADMLSLILVALLIHHTNPPENNRDIVYVHLILSVQFARFLPVVSIGNDSARSQQVGVKYKKYDDLSCGLI